MAFMNQIRNSKAIKPDPFAGCADVSNGFCGRFLPVLARRLGPGKGFQCASDDILGGLVATGSKLGCNQFLTVGVEAECQSHNLSLPAFLFEGYDAASAWWAELADPSEEADRRMQDTLADGYSDIPDVTQRIQDVCALPSRTPVQSCT